ncbi:MAG: S1 RNA-binding domain-containing protein [Candidatus Marsarchaeota archaeon]|nr:S1 RNA-binding domain-containing protein [Candidatus Marsarchaeota archaeon]
MIIQKELPGVGEIVLVHITKIMPHGAYCELVEYKADAYLPINEVASGWIKNIHEFIKEGQRDAAKVVFVDPSRRALDVSLKKVTSKQKKDKINEFNLEKRAEKFFTQAVQAAHKEGKIEEIEKKAALVAPTYSELLDLAVEGKLPDATMESDVRKEFEAIVAKNVKPKEYEVGYAVELRAINKKGSVATIKKAFGEVTGIGVDVLYEGAPHYKLSARGPSYPVVEGKIKEAEKILEKYKGTLSINITKRGA